MTINDPLPFPSPTLLISSLLILKDNTHTSLYKAFQQENYCNNLIKQKKMFPKRTISSLAIAEEFCSGKTLPPIVTLKNNSPPPYLKFSTFQKLFSRNSKFFFAIQHKYASAYLATPSVIKLWYTKIVPYSHQKLSPHRLFLFKKKEIKCTFNIIVN